MHYIPPRTPRVLTPARMTLCETWHAECIWHLFVSVSIPRAALSQTSSKDSALCAQCMVYGVTSAVGVYATTCTRREEKNAGRVL
jgi:hypothetical protein